MKSFPNVSPLAVAEEEAFLHSQLEMVVDELTLASFVVGVVTRTL